MKKLDKLILGSFLGPFLLTFIVVDFILLTVNMLKYFDEIFGKGLGFWIYMELIGYFVISISPMALPLAVLLSSLMTFGNLGEHFELTAIKSSGISLLRALRPIGVFVIILVFGAYLSNNYLVPKVNLKTFSLLYDIRMKSPALDIKEGVFYSGIPGYNIKVNKKVGEYGLQKILIYDHSEGIQGNLNITLADSGRMEPFFNENYMKLSLYNGHFYQEDKLSKGIKDKPANFSRTSFDENIIVFDLNSFKLNRTAEDAWSTNRSIKNISEIKLGLDSINTLINDQRYQTYLTAESVYPFYTRSRKFTPPEQIATRKALADSLRMKRANMLKSSRDSSELAQEEKVIPLDTNKVELDSPLINQDPEEKLIVANPKSKRLIKAVKSAKSQDSTIDTNVRKTENLDSLNSLKEDSIRLVRAEISKIRKRSNPLTDSERAQLDSVTSSRKTMMSAVAIALNNSRSLKNTFNAKKTEIENYEREFRRYQITLYQKYVQAFACFTMFLIGAPLGAIIKKGGLGMPVLISIIFFIVYYMLTITGEKWAKEGLVDPLFGTWFSNLSLLPFGLFFVRQARKDARLFEPDFYQGIWKKMVGWFRQLKSN
jgi:lipopolysaccharide export system permease protein